MPRNVYVIGIGGTGMRCIESFIHLCAIGMFDNTNVHMLAIDTDKLNGNFERLKKLVGNYHDINGGKAKENTFFSANLHYYQFSPDYDNASQRTFNTIVDYLATKAQDVGDNVKTNLSDIVDLFIRPDVGEMPLDHGYRAQTQMGSILMYHAILKEAYESSRNQHASQLRDFLNSLTNETSQPIFVFGSVFGGTGASSLPIIPHAFNDAAKIMFGEGTELVKSHIFASVVLTNYFTFDIKDGSGEVVAKANNFSLNSQAALRFYQNDKTINDVYKRLYMLGRETPISLPSGGTGGKDQCNPSDYLELMAAFAAYDFFKKCDQLPVNPDIFNTDVATRFVQRVIEADRNLSFVNFTDDSEKFMQKLGLMTVASLLDSAYDYFENLRRDSVSFNADDLKPLRNYFKLYGIEPYKDEKGVERVGWLNQVFDSAVKDGFSEGAFFYPQMFKCTSEKDFQKYEFNKLLYNMETPPKFNVGLLTNKFSVVKDRFKDVKATDTVSLESLLERTYLTLFDLYFKN